MIATRTATSRATRSLPTRLSRNYNPKTGFNRGLIAQTGMIPEGQMFLQDTWPLKILKEEKTITEGVGGRELPVMRVTGLFQRGDNQNANGRIYSSPILAEAVASIQEDLSGRQVWGEFDHPPDAKIHLDRISHLITKIWMEGQSVYGEAEIIEGLPYGNQLSTLLKHGSIGISSRGIGDMEVHEHNGQEVYYVTEGYRFVTWDAVAEPSVHGAVLQIQEGKLRPVVKPAIRRKTSTSVAVNRTNTQSKQLVESVLVGELSKYLKSRG